MSDGGKPKKSPDVGTASGSALFNGSNLDSPTSGMLAELVSLFADTVPQSIWITDAQGNVKFLNKHWYEFSGMEGLPATAAEIAADSIHPDDAPAVMAAFDEAIRAGRGFEVEQRNRGADGEYRWFLNRANPYRDPETGEIVLWFGVGTDIHDRKAVEAALKESEERLRLVQAAGGIGSFDYDIKKDEAVCSPEYYELLGLPPDHRINKTIWIELVHPEDRAAAAMALETAIRERKPFDHKYRIVRKDTGEVRWLSGRASIIFDSGGEPWRLVGGNVDVTEGEVARAEQTFLFEISDLIRTAVDPSELLGDIAYRLGRFLGLHRCLFNEIDLESDTETVHRDFSRVGRSVAGVHKISIYSPASSALMESGRTIVNFNSETDPRTASYFEETYKPSEEIAYITVPMMRGGRWVASLWCSDDRPRNWSIGEISLVENIAERTWAAVERLRTESDLYEQRNRQKALAEAALKLAETETLDDQLEVIADEARRLVRARAVAVILIDGNDRAGIVSKFSIDEEPPDSALREMLKDTASFPAVPSSNRPIRLERAQLEVDPVWREVIAADKERRLGGLFLVPVAGGDGRTVGAIRLIERPDCKFTSADEAAMLQLAQLASSVVERTRAHEAAERNRRTFSELVENAPFGMYIVDSDFRISTMNAGSQSGTFANVRPVIGRDLGEATRILWPEPVAEEVIGKFRATLDTGKPYFSRDFTHLRGDIATVESYEWELHRIVMPDGRYGVVCYFYDSTKLREAERRESEQMRRALNAIAKFEAVFNQSGFNAGIVALDGTLLEVNDAAIAESGFAREALIDRPYWEMGWWRDSADTAAVVREGVQAAADGETFRSMLEYRRADGIERLGDFALHPIRDGKGKVIFLYSTLVDVTDWKRAESAKAQLAAIVENSADAIYIFDLDGTIRSWNKAAESLYGWAAEVIVGKKVDIVLPPDRVDEVRVEIIAPIQAGEPVVRLETVRIRADGTRFDCQLTASPIRNEAGGPVMVSVIARDITQRKRMESDLAANSASLANERQRLDIALRVGGLGVYEWKIREDKIWWSPELYPIFGVDPSTFIPTTETINQLVHPDDCDALRRKFSESIEKRSEFDHVYRILRPDGGVRWVRNQSQVGLAPDGTPERVTGVGVDVTESILAEERIRKSEAEYRSLFEAAGIGNAEVELPSGRFIRVNRKFCELAGYSPDELDRLTFFDLTHEDDRERDLDSMRSGSGSSDDDIFEVEKRYLRKDGSSVWVYMTGTLIRDAGGRPVRLLGSATDITSRREAEERLRESEERFRVMADNAPVMIRVTDPAGHCTFLSESWYEYTGQTQEDALGFGWLEASHPDDREQLAAEFHKANTEAAPFRLEYRLKGKDGEYRWALDSAKPRFSETGGFLGFIGSVIDISERKGIEEELRHSEEGFRTVANAAPALVWVTNAAGDIVFLNSRWNEYTGQATGDLLGAGWTSTIPQEDLDVMLPNWEQSRGTGEPFEGECRYRRADGEYRWHTFRALPHFGTGGQINGWYGVSVDIHEQKVVTERVKISEERYRALTELSPQMVYTTRPDGSLTYVNRYALEWTGRSFDELEGNDWSSVIHPDHRERMLSVWNTAAALGSEYEVDVPFRYVDGSYRTLYNRALPIKDGNGDVLYWIGTALDVEDRRRAEESLRESEERFRHASDSAPVLIWMTDETSDLVWFNKPWLDFTGRTMEQELKFGWIDGVHPDDRDRCLNIFTKSFDAHREFVLEYRLRRFDGTFRWLLHRGVPRFTPDGTFLGFIGSCIDIHDRRSAESALRQSEARLQLATQIGKYGTWDINFVEGRQVWSDKLFEIFGVPPAPDRVISSEQYEPFIIPEDLARLNKLHAEALESRTHLSAEYRIRKADTGEIRWLDAAAHYFFDAEGKPTRAVGVTQDITERKLASEAIRASEERLKLAQQAGNVGVWDWDAAANRTFWSDQMWAFYGEEASQSSPDGRFWLDKIHPDDRKRLSKEVAGVLASGMTDYRDEFRIVAKDGQTKWIEVIATVERSESGEATRMYGVNLDITERKAVAERIRSSELQLRLITDSIPALVSYVDRDERYQFVNMRYAEWFGIEPGQIVGHSLTEVLGDAARALLKPRVDEVLAGNTVTFEAWLEYKLAGRRFVHVSYVPDVAEGGEVLGFYALVTDLTAQKQSEEMLRSTEDRMRTISESFTDYAIISMDAEGAIDSWNPGAENIFGYAADEIIGKPSGILFTPEDADRGVPRLELERAEKIGRSSDERWHIRKDGTRFYASGVTAPLHVGDRLAGFAKIATDLTEKKRNAEALQRAYDEMENRVLERTKELASMNETLMREISERQTAERQKIELLKRLVTGQEQERRRIARDLHDHLGQRLTALRLKLASLREACSGDEDLYARATRLQQIAELIDSEVSFLAWELRPSTLDELGLIDAIGAFVKEWSRHYEIDAGFHTNGLGDARLDREAETHLYRIAQEALNNIYKHANAKNVSVILERAGGDVVLIIEDNGAGIGNVEPQKQRSQGRGLGLAGMRERAELIGGALEIESEVGKGTTIYVRIPVYGDKRMQK